MTWVRIDDRFPSHQKGIAAGPLGRDLFVCGLAYCNLHLTDGRIYDDAIRTLAPGQRNPKRIAELLVEIGLWERIDGGYRVHDYHDWNRTSEEVANLIEMKRTAGRNGGLRSGEARRKHRATSSASGSTEAQSKHAAGVLPNPSPIRSNPPISPEAPASTNLDPTIPYAQRTDRRIWTADGYPRAAFRTDCPDDRWRLKCVDPAFVQAHPDWDPHLPAPQLRTCPHHRAKAPEASWP